MIQEDPHKTPPSPEVSESTSSSDSPDSPDSPDSSPAQAGQQIPGYQLLSKLGQGGMGAVYKARQVSLDRIVAIKVLPKTYASNPQFVQRLQAEGKAAAKLNHPNIVGALDVGQAGSIHYFVMEYVQGTTVFDELMENARYDEDEALDVILPIARALAHAHHAGLTHRDVKPQNMMLTDNGVPKLADMGLARAHGQNEDEAKAGVVMGSPYYMSPEQILNKPDVDFRTDIYSLGASFYYMVTGHPPYEAPTAKEVLQKHLRAPLVPPDKANPRISVGVSQIIQVCLAKDRDDRYQDTSELVQDLEAVAADGLPLFAAGKLGLDDLLDEDVAVSPSQGQAATSPANTSEPTAEHAPKLVTAADRSISHERFFWIAVAGWAAAIVFAVLYFLQR